MYETAPVALTGRHHGAACGCRMLHLEVLLSAGRVSGHAMPSALVASLALPLALLVALAGANSSAVSGTGSTPLRPNLIFFLGDEVGWNNVGWHSAVAQTPQLDLLAKSGVILNQHCERSRQPSHQLVCHGARSTP